MNKLPKLSTATSAIGFAEAIGGREALMQVVAPDNAAQLLVTIAWALERGHYIDPGSGPFHLTLLGADLVEYDASPALKQALELALGVAVSIDLVNPAADGYIGCTGPDRRRLVPIPSASIYPMNTEAYWRLKSADGAVQPNLLLAMHPGVVANAEFWTADEGLMQYVRSGIPVVVTHYNHVEATLEGDAFCRHGYDMAALEANPLAEEAVQLPDDRIGGHAQLAGLLTAIVGVDLDQWRRVRDQCAECLPEGTEAPSHVAQLMAPSIRSNVALERLVHGTRMLEAIMRGGGANLAQLRRRIVTSIDAGHRNPYLRAEVAHGLLAVGREDLFLTYTGGDPDAWGWLNGKGESAVHIAAAYGLRNAVDTAISAGAGAWAIDDLGYTPWMRALMNGHVDIAGKLIGSCSRALPDDLYAIFVARGAGGIADASLQPHGVKAPEILGAVMDGTLPEPTASLINLAIGDGDEAEYSPNHCAAIKGMLIQMARSIMSNPYERAAPELIYWCELVFATLRASAEMPDYAAWSALVDLLKRRTLMLEEAGLAS